MSRTIDLNGYRVAITGASSGIGWFLAEELSAAGAWVSVAARSADRLHELCHHLMKSGSRCLAVPTDVTIADHRHRLIEETVAEFGGLDLLVNNAGVGANGDFADSTEECLREIFEVNFFSATELTRIALPHLLRGRDAMIANVSSVIGRRGIPGYGEYCASKFALCGWSEVLRAELADRGVHVLLINPGLIETPFRDHLVQDRYQSQADRGRGMDPRKCARLIVRAIRKRRNELVITAGGKLLLWLNRLFPTLVDQLMVAYHRRHVRASATSSGNN